MTTAHLLLHPPAAFARRYIGSPLHLLCGVLHAHLLQHAAVVRHALCTLHSRKVKQLSLHM